MTERNLLVIQPSFPGFAAKSFSALILKNLHQYGWRSTIVKMRPDHPVGVSPVEWDGVEIINIVPRPSLRDQLSTWTYQKRSTLSAKDKLVRVESGPGQYKRKLYTAGGVMLLPLLAASNFRGKDHYVHHSNDVWESLLRLHEERKFSVVLSIYYGPWTAHTLAKRFASRTGAPWLAIMKDYYSGSPLNELEGYPGLLKSLAEMLKRRKEKEVLKDCKVILANCEPVAEYLRGLLPAPPVRTMLNCFDEEDFADSGPPAGDDSGHFNIHSIGSVHDQDYTPFFQAMSELLQQKLLSGSDLRITFVGCDKKSLAPYLQRFPDVAVEVLPRVPHEEAVRYMKQATVLLLHQFSGFFPRRTPEYMATGRPILAFPSSPGAGTQQVLEQYGAAVIADNVKDIKAALISWYREFQATGRVTPCVNWELVNSFSAAHRAKELNGLLEELVGASAVPIGG